MYLNLSLGKNSGGAVAPEPYVFRKNVYLNPPSSFYDATYTTTSVDGYGTGNFSWVSRENSDRIFGFNSGTMVNGGSGVSRSNGWYIENIDADDPYSYFNPASPDQLPTSGWINFDSGASATIFAEFIPNALTFTTTGSGFYYNSAFGSNTQPYTLTTYDISSTASPRYNNQRFANFDNYGYVQITSNFWLIQVFDDGDVEQLFRIAVQGGSKLFPSDLSGGFLSNGLTGISVAYDWG